MELPFADRSAAGRALAELVADYRDRENVIVLALPRGGVPVATEVADSLSAPLDVMIVRKLGCPGHEELAMGAIASGDYRYLNRDVIRYHQISDADIEEETERETAELHRREERYRGDRPPLQLAGKTVLLVDDGLATGASMEVAIQAVREQQPVEVVVAVPVAPKETLETLRHIVDDIRCLQTPSPFYAIGQWYRDFTQLRDEQVCDLLEARHSSHG